MHARLETAGGGICMPHAVKLFAALALSIVPILPLVAGCSGTVPQHDVAATMNGGEIPEDEVAARVGLFRYENALSDDAAWEKWKQDGGKASSDIRSETIAELAEERVIAQMAAAEGVSASEEEISSRVPEGVPEGLSGEARKKAGAAVLREKLRAALSSSVSDDQILSLASAASGSLDGARKLRCIVLAKDGEEAAAALAEEASSNPGRFDELADGSTLTREYDGWSVMVPTDPAVRAASGGLGKGEVSGVIEGARYLFVVKVEDVYDGSPSSLDDIPAELKGYMEDSIRRSSTAQSFDERLRAATASANVVELPTRGGLPY